MALNFNAQAELTYQRKIVMGVTKFKGVIDGNNIDTCNVLIAAPLSDLSGNGKGFGIAKISFGVSDNFNKFVAVQFPCEMDLAFQTVTNPSGKQKEVLKDIRILTQTKG